MFKSLRQLSFVEACSYLVLMASSIVKRTGGTELGVQIFGMVHGLLFVALALSLITKRPDLGWSWPKTLVAIFIGALPFGGFWLERKWLRDAEVAAL